MDNPSTARCGRDTHHNSAYSILDLFSGIGGFSLGLEMTGGFRTAAFCEIDPFCQKILRRHWPAVPIFSDVRSLKYDGSIDVITGGFPCQDLSAAGNQAGLAGARSGLWGEMLRLCRELLPRYVIVENVAALLTGEHGSWFATVLADLAALGYDAQWHCIPAAAVGAVHPRDRVWVIAYPHQERWRCHEVIYNTIAGEVAACRTPKAHLAILARAQRVPLAEVQFDHRRLDGLSAAVDTTGALGNSVFPKIPYIIGKGILAAAGIEAKPLGIASHAPDGGNIMK